MRGKSKTPSRLILNQFWAYTAPLPRTIIAAGMLLTGAVEYGGGMVIYGGVVVLVMLSNAVTREGFSIVIIRAYPWWYST